MLNIKSDVILPYSAEKIFILVNNISAYSEFVPGCVYSCILGGDDFELVAKMDISKFGINESFVTHNFMVKNESIVIRLVRGPCKSLFGSLKFIYLSEEVSKVEYNFSCEFYSLIVENLFYFFVKEIISDLIESFIIRADKIYNKK